MLVSRANETDLRAVVGPADVLAMQQVVEGVDAGPDVIDYVVRIVEATRSDESLEIGASPRAGLALLRSARAKAALEARSFATPTDVKSLAVPVVAHRLVLRTEAWVRGVREQDVVEEVLASVPTPRTLTEADLESATESARPRAGA